jgi:hypothetical protein
MKRELRFVAIVFGSLFALVVIAVVAFAVVVSRYAPELARNAADPVAAKRTAAKIATFDVPRGYRIASAIDLALAQTVMIRPVDRGSGTFQIQLQGTKMPSGDSQLMGARTGMSIAARFLACNLHDDGTDDVPIRRTVVKFAVMQCKGARGPMRIETGIFLGNAEQVTVTAIGIGVGSFDVDALHELLRSVR